MILEITVATYHGTCPACARTKGAANRLKQFWDYLCACWMVGWMCLMLPFLLTFLGIRRVWRWQRFPFNKRAMLQGIQHYYPDRKEARNYLNGVIDGYWDCEPEYPTLGRPGMPHDFGMIAGGRLRRGEISPSEIP
ncbi:hypothetical protein [Roseimicrobium gellanilyticum]|uniref:hypothetical protein n=1 Tax=Roseimicrobium gellanilyticum TaxID=748857 RepID=UPI001B8704F0|nr:hypothetical protein [Roseimicrobium gellanilyticum]